MEKNKYLTTILMIVSLIGIFITVILIYVIPDKKENIRVDTNKNQTNIEVEEEIEEEKVDFSNYKVDSRFEKEIEFMGNQLAATKLFSENILDDARTRIQYVNYTLLKENRYQLTTDQAQASAFVTKEEYEKQFAFIYGKNYNYQVTIRSIGTDSMWYNECGLYPSVNDGKHICFTNVVGVHGPIYFVISQEGRQNGIYTVSGNYYKAVSSTDTEYQDRGTFEIQYDVSTSHRTIKSIVFEKKN